MTARKKIDTAPGALPFDHLQLRDDAKRLMAQAVATFSNHKEVGVWCGLSQSSVKAWCNINQDNAAPEWAVARIEQCHPAMGAFLRAGMKHLLSRYAGPPPSTPTPEDVDNVLRATLAGLEAARAQALANKRIDGHEVPRLLVLRAETAALLDVFDVALRARADEDARRALHHQGVNARGGSDAE